MNSPIECFQTNDLQRYLDGELANPGAMEAHLRECPQCQAALADYEAIGALLRAAWDEAPADSARAAVLRRAREIRDQASRRVAWSLLAAASVLFVSSVFFAVYTETGRAGSGRILAQWELNIMSSPASDDEFADPETPVLYAIHLSSGGVGGERP